MNETRTKGKNNQRMIKKKAPVKHNLKTEDLKFLIQISVVHLCFAFFFFLFLFFLLPLSGKNRPKKINWVWGVSLLQYESSDLP
jgi:hypothetical protein